MASISSQNFAFTILIIIGTLSCGQNQVMAQDCGANLGYIVSECSAFVQKAGPEIPPSPSCCAALAPVDVPCICKYVTPQIENFVSMEKVVFVARSCGKFIAPGMTCGSYTVPPV